MSTDDKAPKTTDDELQKLRSRVKELESQLTSQGKKAKSAVDDASKRANDIGSACFDETGKVLRACTDVWFDQIRAQSEMCREFAETLFSQPASGESGKSSATDAFTAIPQNLTKAVLDYCEKSVDLTGKAITTFSESYHSESHKK